jgi:PAS domain S-box-containing protein
MQAQIFEDSARLSAIVQSCQDAIISKKPDGTITSWNPAAENIFGFTASEAVGNHVSIIIPEELLDEELLIINKIKSGTAIEHFETVRKKKDGTRILITLTVSPIKDENENFIGTSNIARDITGLRNAREKQAILAAIVDSSDDAIISKTLDGVITSWNYGARKIFGYTANEIVGKNMSIIIPTDRIDEEKMIIENIRLGKKVHHFETARIAKDKRKLNISLTISPIKNENGKVIGASTVARDITEKAELQKKQQLYTEKLKELNNYKDEFMAMASHELNTPLTVIMATLQILEHKMENDANINFVTKALLSVNKLAGLIGNLLDVSKVQSGKFVIQPAKFDLNVLLQQVIEDIQQTSLRHSIIFKGNGKQLIVNADRERIEQVIINLLTNAIKYSPNAQQVLVETYVKNKKIEVCIKDFGIGIPAEELDQVFSRFFRGQGTASTFSGSGIGLYISSEIIKLHRGEIWADSEIGKGATFYFTLPAEL